jgi:hypothetical protein
LQDIIISIEDRVRFRKQGSGSYIFAHMKFGERKDIKIKGTMDEKGRY